MFVRTRWTVVVEVTVQEGGYALGISAAELFVVAQFGGLTAWIPLNVINGNITRVTFFRYSLKLNLSKDSFHFLLIIGQIRDREKSPQTGLDLRKDFGIFGGQGLAGSLKSHEAGLKIRTLKRLRCPTLTRAFCQLLAVALTLPSTDHKTFVVLVPISRTLTFSPPTFRPEGNTSEFLA